MFFCEFADTALIARRGNDVVGYLLGFVAPTGDGYIHVVAVREDARTLGLGRRLYERFAATAGQRGATALKAITSPENESSIAFHRRMGFVLTLEPDYQGSGRPRVVMRRPLDSPAPEIAGLTPPPATSATATWRAWPAGCPLTDQQTVPRRRAGGCLLRRNRLTATARTRPPGPGSGRTARAPLAAAPA